MATIKKTNALQSEFVLLKNVATGKIQAVISPHDFVVGFTGLTRNLKTIGDIQVTGSLYTTDGAKGVLKLPDGTLAIREGSSITIVDDLDGGITISSSGGPGETPATSVTNETTFAIVPVVGVSTNYARQDHTHGSVSLGSTSGTAAAGNDARLSDSRTPVSHASSHQNGGGDEISVTGLSGLLADGQTPVAHASSHQPGGSDTMATDAIAATASLRTLGVGSQQAAAGNDARLSDSRTPTGAAGGQLGGTFPNPDVRGIRETAGPTMLTLGAVADGQLLKRVGNTIIGVTLTFTLAFSGDPQMEPSGQQLSAGRST